jgi:hypothetical protein
LRTRHNCIVDVGGGCPSISEHHTISTKQSFFYTALTCNKPDDIQCLPTNTEVWINLWNMNGVTVDRWFSTNNVVRWWWLTSLSLFLLWRHMSRMMANLFSIIIATIPTANVSMAFAMLL